MARQFPAPKRQVYLTFGHYQEVAALPHDKAEALLERAARIGARLSAYFRCAVTYLLPRPEALPAGGVLSY